MKAYQRIIREEKSKDSKEVIPKKVCIKKAVVKEVSREQAKEIIEEYEWLGCMAAVNWFYYGIFFEGICGGVVIYGQEYIENLGKWDKYGYTGKIILLNRGACVHWAHPHSASKLIRQSMKMLPEKYKVITATVDDLAGEIGTIYQACGFHYIGSMRDNNPNLRSKKGDRSAWLINGKLYGARALRQKHGTTKLGILEQHYPDIKRVKQNSKSRYFAFRGSKKDKKELKKAIESFIKPYPKRDVSDERIPMQLIKTLES
jgi:hypothetical protein